MIKKTLVLVLLIALSGCMTNKSFTTRMAALQPDIDQCRGDVIALANANRLEVPDFADPKDALIWALVMLQEEKVTFDSCNAVAIVAMNNDARLRGALIKGGVSIGSLGLGVWAAADMVDSITDLGKAKGNSTFSNSRVTTVGDGTSGTVHASSSGETVNLGNVEAVNNSTAQGGIQPRQVQTGDVRGDFSGPSQSGEDAPVDIDPGDDGAEIQPVGPEVLPVE